MDTGLVGFWGAYRVLVVFTSSRLRFQVFRSVPVVWQVVVPGKGGIGVFRRCVRGATIAGEPSSSWLSAAPWPASLLGSVFLRVSGDGQGTFSHDEDRPDGNGAFLAAWKLGDAAIGGASFRAVGGEGIFNPDSAVVWAESKMRSGEGAGGVADCHEARLGVVGAWRSSEDEDGVDEFLAPRI